MNLWQRGVISSPSERGGLPAASADHHVIFFPCQGGEKKKKKILICDIIIQISLLVSRAGEDASRALAFCTIISGGELGPPPHGCSLNRATAFLVPLSLTGSPTSPSLRLLWTRSWWTAVKTPLLFRISGDSPLMVDDASWVRSSLTGRGYLCLYIQIYIYIFFAGWVFSRQVDGDLLNTTLPAGLHRWRTETCDLAIEAGLLRSRGWNFPRPNSMGSNRQCLQSVSAPTTDSFWWYKSRKQLQTEKCSAEVDFYFTLHSQQEFSSAPLHFSTHLIFPVTFDRELQVFGAWLSWQKKTFLNVKCHPAIVQTFFFVCFPS